MTPGETRMGEVVRWRVVTSIIWRTLLVLAAAGGLAGFASALLSAVGGDPAGAHGVFFAVVALVLLTVKPTVRGRPGEPRL